MKRKFLAVSLMMMLLVLGGCSSSQTSKVLEGVVETTILSQYSEVSGKITKLPIELGQQVKAGDVIAIIDDSNEQYALEQLKTTLAKKQAVLAELNSAYIHPEEIKQGQNNVILAQKAVERALILNDKSKKDYETTRSLYEGGGVAQSALDNAKYQLDLTALDIVTTQTQLDNANQKLALLNQGIDNKDKIASAQADIAQTESQIRQEKDKLAKYKITAISDGTIISKNYVLGDIVAPSYNLADIASEAEKVLVAYLPEDQLSNITYGQELVIKKGEKEYKGTVSFIDLEAQYTPKDMQTSANKNKDSVKIKVRLAEDTPLKPGEGAKLLVSK